MKSLLTAYIDISVWKLFSYTIFCVGMLLFTGGKLPKLAY